MKKQILKTMIAAFAAFQINTAMAQLQLPAPSPKASVMQTVGLTDITIDYSSPAVKGRAIWGDLVPYDKLWRAGANSATKITFSKDVTIEGVSVPKGSYSIFVIPAKGDWTVIINKNASASTDEYKQEMDVVRVKTTPSAISMHERMAFTITDFTNDAATVCLEWEKMHIGFKVNCATTSQAEENIKNALGGTWRTYNSAARYAMDNKNYDKGLEYVNTSLSLADEWFNNWTKAQLLAEKGMKADAYKYAAKAKELGDKNPQGFFFKDNVEKGLNDWKAADGKKKK